MIDKNGSEYIIKLRKVLKVNLIVLIANISIGILGFGHIQYRGGFGTRGFFYAGNEMSALVIVLFSFSLFFIFRNYNRKYYYLVALLYLVLALFSSTKVSMFGILASIIVIPYLNKAIDLKKIFIVNFKSVLKIAIIITLGIYLIFVFIRQTGLLNRWEFFFTNMYNNDIFSFLLSGRNLEAKEMIETFFTEHSFFRNLIGLGAGNEIVVKTVEMDFIDILVNFGYLGVITIGASLIIIFRKIYKNNLNPDYEFAVYSLYIISLLLPISVFTGHIVFSAMTGIFISIVSSLAYYKRP
jgi:hypothetical protein